MTPLCRFIMPSICGGASAPLDEPCVTPAEHAELPVKPITHKETSILKNLN